MTAVEFSNIINTPVGYAGLFIVIIFWIYTIIWSIKDIYFKSESWAMRVISALIVIFLPIIGWLIYILIRPYQSPIIQLHSKSDDLICDHCHKNNDIDHDYCVFCGELIKTICKECKYHYPSNYLYCCKCGAPNISK